MEALELIKTRRSIRKYKDEVVSKEVMNSIMDSARFAPSWANFQIARYTFVNDEAVIKKLVDNGVNDFVYNIKTLKNAKNVAILSYVKGKSGKLDKEKYATTKKNSWEMFDSGIACQTFCLAAYAHNVGTCVMGVIDEKAISEIVNLPEDEIVAALIVYGYPSEDVQPTPRKDVKELVRFI